MENRKNFSMTLKYIVMGAAIAAIYATLTLVLQPISFSVYQVRVSEALSILPYFTSSAVPGLFIGCLIANLLGGAVIWDVVFGSIATLIAAAIAYFMKKHNVSKFLIPLPSVIANTIIIGLLMRYVYNFDMSLLLCMLSIFVGQAIACYVVGIPLMLAIEKIKIKWE